LAERGIDFIAVDPFSPPCNPFGRGHPFFAGLDPLRALVVMFHHRSADLVISVFESSAVVLILLRRLLFFKTPVTLWDVSVGSDWRPRRLALSLVLPRIDKLFSLTQWQKAAVERQYRLRAPADVLGFAVDEDFYHPKFNQEAHYVLSVGEDVARDYTTLVTAVQDLPIAVVLKTSREVTFPAGCIATVTVMKEHLSSLQLRDLYGAASIAVIPLCSSDHPSGISSLFEAMAMGKAIIASDVPMVREFITSGETGVIVPVGDAEALGSAIAFLLARPDERRRLGVNVRAYLEANLTLTSFADRYAASIRDVVRRRTVRRQRDNWRRRN
jgi:glycosyltransferase involved in cell wall biosynthesis